MALDECTCRLYIFWIQLYSGFSPVFVISTPNVTSPGWMCLCVPSYWCVAAIAYTTDPVSHICSNINFFDSGQAFAFILLSEFSYWWLTPTLSYTVPRDVPTQHSVSFCCVSKMSLASIMKTVFICLEVRVEIFICLQLHRMLILSLYTWFAWAKRDPTGLGRPRIDTEGKPAPAQCWSGDTCSLDYAADSCTPTNWIKTRRRQEVTRFGRVPPITWTSVE